MTELPGKPLWVRAQRAEQEALRPGSCGCPKYWPRVTAIKGMDGKNYPSKIMHHGECSLSNSPPSEQEGECQHEGTWVRMCTKCGHPTHATDPRFEASVAIEAKLREVTTRNGQLLKDGQHWLTVGRENDELFAKNERLAAKLASQEQELAELLVVLEVQRLQNLDHPYHENRKTLEAQEQELARLRKALQKISDALMPAFEYSVKWGELPRRPELTASEALRAKKK